MTLPTSPLSTTGVTLTQSGFGCAALAGMYRPCSDEDAQAALQAAWSGGIRHFDTAPFYGSGVSEERLARFLATKPRSDFTVSTKAGRLLTPTPNAPFYGFHNTHSAQVTFDYTGTGLRRSLDSSLKRLNLTHIDILLIHDIGTLAHTPNEAARHWRDLTTTGLPMLQALKADGTIRAWGLGVNEVQVCLDLLAITPLDVILMANRFTLLDRSARPVLDRLHDQGGSAIIGGVFNSGILATGPVPGAMYDYQPASEDILSRTRAIDAICTETGTDRIAAALQFPLTHPAVASVLISAVDPEMIRKNLAAFQMPVKEALRRMGDSPIT